MTGTVNWEAVDGVGNAKPAPTTPWSRIPTHCDLAKMWCRGLCVINPETGVIREANCFKGWEQGQKLTPR